MKRFVGKPLLWILVLALVSGYTALWPSRTAAQEQIPETKKIKVGLLSPSATQTPLWVADDGGYFEKYGLSVEIVIMGTSAKTVAALMSGDIQFGTGVVGQALNAAAAGGDLVAISDMMSRSAFRLIGAKGIETVEDLRGKRIGVPSLGSFADAEVRAVLAQHGMQVPRDAQVIGVGGLPEIFAALTNGSIQAGILVAPQSFPAFDAGMKLLVTPAQLQKWNIPSDQTKILSTRAWLAKNPVTTELFLKGFLEGLHRTMTDRDFTAQVIAKYTGVDLATAERAYDDLEAGFGPVEAFITEEQVGKIKDVLMAVTDNPKLATTPNSAAIDMSFLEKLDQSGFIDSITDNK